MKLKTILTLLVLMMSVIIGAFSGLAYVSIGELTGNLQRNSANAESYAKLLNESRQAQVAFQVQVQEWKNILVRGNDKELYERHLKGFNERAASMTDTLTAMRPRLDALKINVANIDELLKSHAELNTKYLAALTSFDPADELSGKAVDKLVRGMDRPTSAALTALGNQIEKAAVETLSTATNSATKISTQTLNTFYIVAAVALTMTLLFCLGVARNVLKKVGGDPGELSKAFTVLALGDFSQPILVKENDESSIAAKAALMQLKVRSMLRAIQNGSKELEETTAKIDIMSTPEEIKETLRIARRAVKGVVTAANRVKA